MSDKHREVYREEAYELLGNLENTLLELEESPCDMEIVGNIFRTMHTIKGSGAMFGFDNIATFTHEVETVFDQVRNGNLLVTKDLIDLTLQARDIIKSMLDGETVEHKIVNQLIQSFQALLPEQQDLPTRGTNKKYEYETLPPNAPITYRIRFRPSPYLFQTGTNPILLLNEIKGLGECRVIAQLDLIPTLEDIDHELCYTYWDILLTTHKGSNEIKDVFIFVEDNSEITIDVIDEGDFGDTTKRLGEILIERGDITKEDLDKTLSMKKPIGELLIDAGITSRDKVHAALVEQEHIKEIRKKQQKDESVSSIRVAAQKLDKLVDLVGELVTVQAHLTQKAGNERDPELVLISEEIERLTEELRDTTMSVRMMPIGSTFSRFKRLVRDLSRELGKEIELTTEGAETELDKTVIERLNDPLVHIIRNCVDHGIEAPELREALGKPRVGMIHLSAKHSGANVLIEITDDGAGLDKDRIWKKAVENGFIAVDANLPEKEIYSLIFAPGFSTAEKVSNVSGRGVGMDVVKKTIDSLRGSVEVHSEKGTGTTITLKLPLTLAIIEGLLVEVGRHFFILPLSVVRECIELTREDVEKAHGKNIAIVRDELVPYIRIRDAFRINGPVPIIEQIVITEIERNRVGFVVDDVVGEHQTVIKSLGKVYKHVNGVSGATILGDGTVALIMDVARLAANVYMNEGGTVYL